MRRGAAPSPIVRPIGAGPGIDDPVPGARISTIPDGSPTSRGHGAEEAGDSDLPVEGADILYCGGETLEPGQLIEFDNGGGERTAGSGCSVQVRPAPARRSCDVAECSQIRRLTAGDSTHGLLTLPAGSARGGFPHHHLYPGS